MVSQVYDVADSYVERMAAQNPLLATALGVPGYDGGMADLSPDGADEAASINRDTLAQLDAAPTEGERDRIAADAMRESLTTSLELYEDGEHLRDLNILGSPVQELRMIFDLMPTETEEHWRNIASRMALVPEGLVGYQTSLQEGLRQGGAGARRQAVECADQATLWGGGVEGQPSFFAGLLSAYDSSALGSSPLRRDLERAAEAAGGAYLELATFLRDSYAPAADERDAVGAERYGKFARVYCGSELDLHETYAWGWEELRWVESEMRATAEKILPGEGVEAAKALLETDPERAIDGVEPFRQWMQDLQDKTIHEMDGVHFDIPEQVKTVEALIAPPGGALAMYYTPPSEDFSRPGRTWYPTGGKTRFPLWGEVSIAYHEGVPGHHFQQGITKYLSKDLSRFQRLMGWVSGHGEGWALYTERLMAELGYLDNPDYYLGMLRAQALRDVRVIIDIGMHLQLPIPADEGFHPGEVWTPELGLEFIQQRSHFPLEFVASEISRYLGLPGQAISYKVGERAWLDARTEAKSRAGGDFDLKRFHTRALNLGPMGLDQMKREMERI
jgi:uncharacterized protein (DUF885 family)